jgi:hypothetical protein
MATERSEPQGAKPVESKPLPTLLDEVIKEIDAPAKAGVVQDLTKKASAKSKVFEDKLRVDPALLHQQITL